MAEPATISLQVKYERASRQLAKLGRSLDSRQLLNAIGLRWLQWIDDNLRMGGIPPWPTMSPNTVAVNPRRSSNRHLSSQFATRIRQSFTVEITSDRVTVGTNQEYADYTDRGTRPHKIVPRNAKVLRFRTATGTVFAQEVNHPGQPPRPLVPTKAVAETLAFRVLDAYVTRAIKDAESTP